MGVRLWFASEKMEPPAPNMRTTLNLTQIVEEWLAETDILTATKAAAVRWPASTYSRLRYLINGRTVIHIPA